MGPTLRPGHFRKSSRDEESKFLPLVCEVSETVFDGRQRGENTSAHSEIHRTHVRAFHSAIEAQGDTAKIGGGHLAVG